MNDCPDTLMRDRLPDLVEGAMLREGDRRAVEAHLAGCADCRQEMEILRAARVVLFASVPSVDSARILAALAIPAPLTVVGPSRWSTPAIWRMAAAVALVALGGGAFISYRGMSRPQVAAERGAIANVQVGESALRIASNVGGAVAGSGELTVREELPSLSEQELAQLVEDIENIEALPLAEPSRRDPVAGAAVPIVADSVIGIFDI